MSSGLIAISTTLPVLDNRALTPLHTETVPGWMRFLAANRLASSGPEWAEIMCRQNSGSYTNQWMIVDLGQFEPSQHVADDFLTIIEQLPSKCVSADMTANLLQGYWPSYNRPFFKEVFDILGYTAAVKSKGEFWDYQKYCGAGIFRRDAPRVQSVGGMQRFLRYNNYKHDDLCELCAVDGHHVGACGIASRDDLNPGYASNESITPVALWKRMPAGAIDAKVSTAELARKMSWTGVAGPTHDSQPIFDWRSTDVHVMHTGQALRFDFMWQHMEPQHKFNGFVV